MTVLPPAIPVAQEKPAMRVLMVIPVMQLPVPILRTKEPASLTRLVHGMEKAKTVTVMMHRLLVIALP
jgi:hypothetical protein